MTFTKKQEVNKFLNKIGRALNIINTVAGILIGIAHVYIPAPSLLGLFLGIVMSCSSAMTMYLSYYFTSVNTQVHSKKSKRQEEERYPELQATPRSRAFLAFAIPLIPLSAGSCFFGFYTGLPLLFAALGGPLGPAAVLAITLILASIQTIGMLINCWLQVNNVADSLKIPVKQEVKSKQVKLRKLELQLKASKLELQNPRLSSYKCSFYARLSEPFSAPPSQSLGIRRSQSL